MPKTDRTWLSSCIDLLAYCEIQKEPQQNFYLCEVQQTFKIIFYITIIPLSEIPDSFVTTIRGRLRSGGGPI